MKVAFMCEGRGFEPGGTLSSVYGPSRRDRIAGMAVLYPEVINLANLDQHAAGVAEVEALFSTWGMPMLTEAQLQRLPALKAVFYAAGSVRSFAEPLLKRGIKVINAHVANAVPVAEFTQAQILLGLKGYMRNMRDYRSPQAFHQAFRGPGIYGETVALLGAGAIGRKVIELLRPFRLRVVVYDPYLGEADAAALGVVKVSLEEAFSSAFVVSNHIPDLPATRGLLTGALFRRMRPGAVFINTGRGATVVESELLAVWKERSDLTALLDVTMPEPPEADSPFYSMPNIWLTSHIAGSLNDELVRMADLVIDEFKAWREAKPLRYAISLEQFATMA